MVAIKSILHNIGPWVLTYMLRFKICKRSSYTIYVSNSVPSYALRPISNLSLRYDGFRLSIPELRVESWDKILILSIWSYRFERAYAIYGFTAMQEGAGCSTETTFNSFRVIPPLTRHRLLKTFQNTTILSSHGERKVPATSSIHESLFSALKNVLRRNFLKRVCSLIDC